MILFFLDAVPLSHNLTYPAGDFPVLTRPMRIRNLVVFVVAVRQVLQDGTALKDADLLAVLKLVRQGGDATIGVNLQEPRLLLLILHHLDGVHLRACVSE